MTGWNLPPGVTDRMIDEASGALEDDFSDLPEEAPETTDLSDDDDGQGCTHPEGHSWVYTGTEYGGDDPSYRGEGRCYCEFCGADGDA